MKTTQSYFVNLNTPKIYETSAKSGNPTGTFTGCESFQRYIFTFYSVYIQASNTPTVLYSCTVRLYEEKRILSLRIVVVGRFENKKLVQDQA